MMQHNQQFNEYNIPQLQQEAINKLMQRVNNTQSKGKAAVIQSLNESKSILE